MHLAFGDANRGAVQYLLAVQLYDDVARDEQAAVLLSRSVTRCRLADPRQRSSSETSGLLGKTLSVRGPIDKNNDLASAFVA
jgi:hypothetical protein